MSVKYNINRKYRDFKFIDPEEPSPKKAILISKPKNKNIFQKIAITINNFLTK